jgi:hypothetical protein
VNWVCGDLLLKTRAQRDSREKPSRHNELKGGFRGKQLKIQMNLDLEITQPYSLFSKPIFNIDVI